MKTGTQFRSDEITDVPDDECRYCNGNQWLYSDPELGPCMCNVPEGFVSMTEKTKATRGRPKKTEEDKAAAKAAAEQANAFLDALDFVAPAATDTGESYAIHAAITQKWLSCFDGTIMIATPVAEEMTAYPRFRQLRDALKRAGSGGSVTVQGAEHRIIVKSGRSKFGVECEPDPARVMRPGPDVAVGPLDARFVDALRALLPLTAENVQSDLENSILVAGNHAYATDRAMMAEYTHGNNISMSAVLPRKFADRVTKIKKDLYGYGISDISFTIWYTDGSFVRTKLYNANTWPTNFSAVLPELPDPASLVPIPAGLFDALRDCQAFANEDSVIFDKGKVRTHDVDNVGCVITVAGLVEAPVALYSIKRLLRLDGLVSSLDYTSDADYRLQAFGDNLRAIITTKGTRSGRGEASDYAGEFDGAEGEENSEETAAEVARFEAATGFTVAPGAPAPAAAIPEGFAVLTLDAEDPAEPEPEPEPEDVPPPPPPPAGPEAPETAYDWRQYTDPGHYAFANGVAWAQAGHPATACPVDRDSEDGRRWYEGWRAIASPRRQGVAA